MKRRQVAPLQRDSVALRQLCIAFATLQEATEVRAFLEDLCTPAEIEAMADRWRVVPLIDQGVPYRDIHDQTGVSVTTVGRVARCLAAGAGGYRLALDRQPASDAAQSTEQQSS